VIIKEKEIFRILHFGDFEKMVNPFIVRVLAQVVSSLLKSAGSAYKRVISGEFSPNISYKIKLLCD